MIRSMNIKRWIIQRILTNKIISKKQYTTYIYIYIIVFDFETSTSGEKHMPHLCWIYNDDIQHECVGINTCAIDMLNALPTDKNELSLNAHNSDYDCRFILEHLDM